MQDETTGAQIEWHYYLEKLIVPCFVFVVSMVMLVLAAAKAPDDCPLLKFMNVRRTYAAHVCRLKLVQITENLN